MCYLCGKQSRAGRCVRCLSILIDENAKFELAYNWNGVQVMNRRIDNNIDRFDVDIAEEGNRDNMVGWDIIDQIASIEHA